MPGELHAGVFAVGTGSALHHPLLVEEEDVWPQEGGGDFAHEVAEDEARQAFAVAVAAADEVALAAMGDAVHVGAEAIQVGVHAGDEVSAFFAEHCEVGGGDCGFEDGEALALEFLSAAGFDVGCGRRP